MPRYIEGSDPIDVAVGARVRLRRRHLHMSQGKLAEPLGVTFQQVQKYEHGGNRISTSMLVKIAAKLETTVATLVGEDGLAPTNPFHLAQMTTPGAIELLEAFSHIKDATARSSLVTVAQGLAADSNGRAKLYEVS